jgi:hypothetical protein
MHTQENRSARKSKKKFKQQLAMHISALAAYNNPSAILYQNTPKLSNFDLRQPIF